MATNPWPSETRLENRPMIQKAFDPERVERFRSSTTPMATWVRAEDFDSLLRLYRELKAQQAFHGF